MEKEIQQAACMYAANTENWATSDGLQTEYARRIQNAFIGGVLWHMQNMWHEAKESPPSTNISILELYRKKNGGFGSRFGMWTGKETWEEHVSRKPCVVLWCKTDDIYPKNINTDNLWFK